MPALQMLVNLIRNSLLARRRRPVTGHAIIAHRIRSLSPRDRCGTPDGPLSHEKAQIKTLSPPSIRALIEMLGDGFNEPGFAAMRRKPSGRMVQCNQRPLKRFKHGLRSLGLTAWTDFA
jgi:hypothetical protein